MKNFYLALIFLSVLSVFLLPSTINAQDLSGLESQMEIYDFNELDNITQDISNTELSFSNIVKDVADGNFEFSISKFISDFLKSLFSEIYVHASLMRNVIIICILSGILKSFTDSFKTKEVSELGFYICYIAIIMLLISSFSVGVGILQSTVHTIVDLIKASTPLIIGLLCASGETIGAGLFSPLILGGCSLVLLLIDKFTIPMINICAVVSIANYITQKELLNKLSSFLSFIVTWSLRGFSIIFIGIIYFQKLGISASSNAVNKSVKAAVNAVPIVGDVFIGAVDSVFYWTQLLKSGVSIAIVVSLIFISFVPIIKIVAIIIIYKVTAIIIQPICDPRISNCIDELGNHMLIALAALFTALLMFIFASSILLSMAGG